MGNQKKSTMEQIHLDYSAVRNATLRGVENNGKVGGDRMTEREAERKLESQDRKTNQCSRFASLYSVHHAKQREEQQREELDADVTAERCPHLPT